MALRSRKRIRPRNPERRASEWARAFGSRVRVLFVAALPCRVPICRTEQRSENAHATTGGTSRKADADKILPLCRRHHRELHGIGRRTFEARHGIDLLACAEWTEWKWRQAGDFPDLEY